MKSTNINKNEQVKIEAVKLGMSQFFDESSKVIAYTELKLNDPKSIELFKALEDGKKVKIMGNVKGRGFAGVVKRWGFSATPKSHGHLFPRSTGSIGTQGQGRVIPGKKMPGRMGNNRKTIITKYLGLDSENMSIKIKGGVPGARNSKVYIYLPKT